MRPNTQLYKKRGGGVGGTLTPFLALHQLRAGPLPLVVSHAALHHQQPQFRALHGILEDLLCTAGSNEKEENYCNNCV